MARHKKSLPSVSTFQIDNYERGRLKSFPPRAIPKRRIIRFGLRSACDHSQPGSCPQCLAAKNHSTSDKISGETKAIVRFSDKEWPENRSKIDRTVTGRLSQPKSVLNCHVGNPGAMAGVLSWWSSLSNSNCTERQSTRGVQVSRDLLQAVLSDRLAFAALSALVYSCDLVAAPEFDRTKTWDRVLQQKQRVCSMLRKRLENDDSISDQIIMTIFFLLTFDVSSDTQ